MPYPAAFAELLKTPEFLSQTPPALTQSVAQSAPDSALPPLSEATQPIISPNISPSISPNNGIAPAAIPTPGTPSGPIPIPSLPSVMQPLAADGMIELKADRQTYDDRRQIFTAEGNVFMRFRDSRVKADRLQVNLVNRFAVAEGNVTFVKGSQVLQGDRFDYNFVQGNGSIRGAKGEIATQSTQDFTGPLSTDV